MQTRVLHTKIWKDSYIRSLSVKERLLFIYLLTNNSINMCGIYELDSDYICFETGLTKPELKKAKDKLSLDRKVLFKDGWIVIKNHAKYNSYGKGKWQEIALQKELQLIPKHILDTSMDTSMDTSVYTTINNKYKTINNKEETKKENKYTTIKSVREDSELINKISKDYSVSVVAVKDAIEDVEMYCGKFSKKYDDYNLAVRSFIRNDLKSGKLKKEDVIYI